MQDFLHLLLGSADIILGVAWLETLRKNKFDYLLSLMDFYVGEWQVQLQGDRNLVKSQVSLKLIMKAFDKEGQGMIIKLSIVEIYD